MGGGGGRPRRKPTRGWGGVGGGARTDGARHSGPYFCPAAGAGGRSRRA
ncbi:RNA-binding protein, partial [Klebsiella quasipneumoniae]